jgi:hypothetical protein
VSEFDKNFKIKVEGSWCEYQQDQLIDLRKIKQVVSYRDEMGWPFKFYFIDGGYLYVQRAEIGKQIEQALKDLSKQPTKVEQLDGELRK